MTFFEIMIALLLLAVMLLQISRRSWLPYPTLLAAAGVAVALIPGLPAIGLDGHTALALFIAPVLLDAAFDFPLATIRKLWRPLVALAVVAVLLTTAVVAWLGWAFAGLPVAAAITLGAIVAPPDVAAATSVLQSARLPRRTVQLLTGESLLNDASALLLYTGALAVQTHGGLDGGVALRLGLAVPGGIALGLTLGWMLRHVTPHTRGSLGGNLLEFANTYFAWLLAERLGLSAVLCVVTMGMYVSYAPEVTANARNRVQSFAVWSTAVFLLNVLAFLLMGMQARAIIGSMSSERLQEALGFAALVVGGVLATRLAWVLAYTVLAARIPALHGEGTRPRLRDGFAVGWCGMRGLVTLATAFALPHDFPQRDLITLTAFAVVLATLVVQGLTLFPLTRLLRIGDDGVEKREEAKARVALADAALGAIAGKDGAMAEEMRRQFAIDREALDGVCGDYEARQKIKLHAIAAQRERLEQLRDSDAIGAELFLRLQEEIDWHDLSISPDGRQPIEQG